ncbi:MAG: DUF3991 and TOPRIM domain-containing protein [Syntrophobacteraceae bacterium]
MRDEELEQFKKGINLSEFAASKGYVIDHRESWGNKRKGDPTSLVMRHPNGDKIVIGRDEKSGDWIYYSIRDDRDNGTIIHFLQHRGGGSLGQVRKTLRPWLGSDRPVVPASSYVQTLVPTSKDRAGVIAEWERARVCTALPYLTSRGLGPDVLALPRFAGRVRVDRRNNALFPHYDKDGLCGFEIKNRGFTGFASGGTKGLWYSKAEATDRELVLVESAINAYSYQVLHPDELWTRYMSTGGELSPQQRGDLDLKQPGLLRLAMEKLPAGAVVLLAFDKDGPGEKLAEKVAAMAPDGREVRLALPDVGKDWNDMLKYRLGLT